MDELEITGIVKDNDGTISHCGIKGYGIQNVELIEKLIMEESCSFFVYVGEEKKAVFVGTSADGAIFLTTDPNGYNKDTLNFLQILDKPLFKRLIEPTR